MGSTGSLEATEAASVAVQKTPNRVSLDSMVAKIAAEFYLTGADAYNASNKAGNPLPADLSVMTLCMLVMQNGFILIGKSAPADPANYNEALGRKFAREDAIRQLWPLEGYALRERLSA